MRLVPKKHRVGGRLGSAQSSNQPQYAFSPSPFLCGFSPYQNGRLPQTYSISIRNSWLLSSSTVLQKKHEKIVKFLLSYGKLTICTSFSFRCSLLDKHVIELNISCSSLLSYLPLPNFIDEWNITHLNLLKKRKAVYSPQSGIQSSAVWTSGNLFLFTRLLGNPLRETLVVHSLSATMQFWEAGWGHPLHAHKTQPVQLKKQLTYSWLLM